MTRFEVPGARGQRLAAWAALPITASADCPAPIVVALHGWGANASTLSGLIRPMVSAGIGVVLFDAASHGESSVEAFSSLPRFAEDLASVLTALRGWPALNLDRLALLGHSVGAAAVLLHAARQGGVRAVVSLSAFAHPREVMERWLETHRIPRRWPGHAILAHVQSVIGEPFDGFAPAHRVADVTCPVLLVHGRDDQTVPVRDAHRLLERLSQGDLLVVSGDHDLRASLLAHPDPVLRFLREHLLTRPDRSSTNSLAPR